LQENLVERIAPRLRHLQKGGYARAYRGGKKRHASPLAALVVGVLDSLGIRYRENVRPVPGSDLTADVEAANTLFFAGKGPGKEDSEVLRRLGKRVVLVSSERVRSDRSDPGVRVIELGGGQDGRLQTIFIDDPSFNFDYAHILPHTQKCSVMHGHTSSALVEVIGRPIDGMVVDFGVAKDIVRSAVRSLDHKLFISDKYVVKEEGGSVTIKFKTVHGDFSIVAPKATTVLLEGEATVENLARELLERVEPGMPANVTALGVYVYEGLNKGSHVLAQLHASGAEPRRKKP